MGIASHRGHMSRTAVEDGSQQAVSEIVAASTRIGTIALALGVRGQNVVVSPSSIVFALALLTEGARGVTLAELDTVLGASGEERRLAVARLRRALSVYDGDPAVVQEPEPPRRPVVHLAARIVLDETLDAEPGFLTHAGTSAALQRADLTTAASKEMLDGWVRHHTGGLVERSAIVPAADMRLVLQDAVVLAAQWRLPFDPNSTSPQRFTLADGTVITTETMSSIRQASYAEADGWRAVRLPYAEALHADILLPPPGKDPADAPFGLLARICGLLDDAVLDMVELTLPELDLKPGEFDVAETIAAAGAPSVFDPATADLTGIAPASEALYASKAVQQAVLKVDEQGTVAAAVTEIAVCAAGLPPRPVRAVHFDRPFLFAVVHAATRWPLFLAAVHDPRH